MINRKSISKRNTHVKKKRKKKIEFSKKLVTWALIFTTISVLVSYVLSFFDHDGLQETTVAIITSCIAIAVSYEAKSYGEKNSRNKYGIDEEGNKIKNTEDFEEEN